jgi:uncharacterized repeat protein (TIGR03803 family)
MNKPIYFRLKTGTASRLVIAVILLVLAGRVFNASAQIETNIYSFTGSPPQVGLAQGLDGNFYSTTYNGGTSNYGTVFRITPGGTYTNLYSFTGPPDGAQPIAELVRGTDGNFYGTTANGGTSTNSSCFGGCGTVFRITPGGTYTNLYSFSGSPTDGYLPQAGLVQGADGNFYGTTSEGGMNGNGTVFRISSSGTETNLHSFDSSSTTNGSDPLAGLVQGSDGNFYGTTEYGGQFGYGTVFRITPAGSYINLYSFGSFPTDGELPEAALVQGADGNFYGTTSGGGTNSPPGGWGTVFRITPSAIYTILYSFHSHPNDGFFSFAGLVQATDGNFYGMTPDGGTSGDGTIFRITPSGTYTSLYSFVGSPDGRFPGDRLIQATDGNLYGTTTYGGINDSGTVCRLTIPLSPPPYPINQITNVQVVTTNTILTIPSIAGETYQLQFSSSMKPTNWVNVSGVSVTNSIGALLTLTNFGGAVGPQGFYRFDITP